LEVKSGDYVTRLLQSIQHKWREYLSIGGEEWRVCYGATRISEAIIYKDPTEGEGGNRGGDEVR
jgi:hypothetical protein